MRIVVRMDTTKIQRRKRRRRHHRRILRNLATVIARAKAQGEGDRPIRALDFVDAATVAPQYRRRRFPIEMAVASASGHCALKRRIVKVARFLSVAPWPDLGTRVACRT